MGIVMMVSDGEQAGNRAAVRARYSFLDLLSFFAGFDSLDELDEADAVEPFEPLDDFASDEDEPESPVDGGLSAWALFLYESLR